MLPQPNKIEVLIHQNQRKLRFWTLILNCTFMKFNTALGTASPVYMVARDKKFGSPRESEIHAPGVNRYFVSAVAQGGFNSRGGSGVASI